MTRIQVFTCCGCGAAVKIDTGPFDERYIMPPVYCEACSTRHAQAHQARRAIEIRYQRERLRSFYETHIVAKVPEASRDEIERHADIIIDALVLLDSEDD